jgi:pimeloyl-ACP methyl ester carboxylesterase
MRISMHDVVPGEVWQTFDAELEEQNPLPGVDGIEYWGRPAAAPVSNEVGGEIPPDVSEADLEYLELPDASGKPTPTLRYSEGSDEAFAFHEREAVVANVTGLKEIEITQDERHTSPLADRGQISRRLEFRHYAGRIITEGEAEFDAGSNTIRVEVPDGPEGEPLGLAARFLQTAGKLLSRPLKESSDPLMWRRLQKSEARYSASARNFPDIGEVTLRHGQLRIVQPADQQRVLIFIHGTMSCALPAMAQLDLPPHPTIRTFRFEHDTFRPLSDNAEALVEAIKAYAAKATKIFLVAHSRGGLVARHAAAKIDKEVQVYTFGTPHLGTPIATAGVRSMNILLAGGRAGIRGLPLWEPVSLAAKTFLASRLPHSAPDGIKVMIPGSPVRAIPVPPMLRSWGGM